MTRDFARARSSSNGISLVVDGAGSASYRSGYGKPAALQTESMVDIPEAMIPASCWRVDDTMTNISMRVRGS